MKNNRNYNRICKKKQKTNLNYKRNFKKIIKKQKLNKVH